MDYSWVLDGFVWLAKLATIVHLIIKYDNLATASMPKGRAIMPKATVDVSKTEKFELKTLPASGKDEAGFVVLRRMTYGEFLRRRDMVSQMSFKGQGKDTEALMVMAQEKVALFEFSSCIVDHNLEDENGKPLDFRTARTFNVLDPSVGEEIADLIDEYNGFNKEKEDELGNSVVTSIE